MWVSKGGLCISVKSPGFYPPWSPLCSTLPPVAWFSALPMPGPAPPEARSLLMGYRCCLSPVCLRETGSQAVSGTHTPSPSGLPAGNTAAREQPWPAAFPYLWPYLAGPAGSVSHLQPKAPTAAGQPPLPPQSSHHPLQALCALRDPAAAPP